MICRICQNQKQTQGMFIVNHFLRSLLNFIWVGNTKTGASSPCSGYTPWKNIRRILQLTNTNVVSPIVLRTANIRDTVLSCIYSPHCRCYIFVTAYLINVPCQTRRTQYLSAPFVHWLHYSNFVSLCLAIIKFQKLWELQVYLNFRCTFLA